MKASQLQRLWTVVGSILVYWTINSWIVSQGGQEVFGIKLVSPHPVPAALIAIPVCSSLLILTSLIGCVYARRFGEGTWTTRIPIVWINALRSTSIEAQLYQGFMLIAFSFVPVAGLVHFWDKVLGAKIVTTGNPPALIESMWSWSALTTWNDPARICTNFKLVPTISCSGNATLLPGVEPLAFAVLTTAAVGTAIAHWIFAFRRKQNKR